MGKHRCIFTLLLLTMGVAATVAAHPQPLGKETASAPAEQARPKTAEPADTSAEKDATPAEQIHARERGVASFFDGPFVTHTTDNFCVHSDHSDWAQEAGSLLEYAHERFYDTWGENAAPLTEPLTWIGFNQRDHFHRYAEQADQIDMSWSDGYYSARTNRVVVVHPATQRTTSRSGGKRSDSDVLARDDDEDDHAHAFALVDTGQVTHEAAHQIAFNSGLQRRGVMYPLWVSEGLATNFETNPDGDFGPTVDNPNRRHQLLRAWQAGRMMSLEELIVTTRVPRNADQPISEVYAQCWALFQYLYLEHEAELKQYLAALAEKGTGHRRNRVIRREFSRAFGSVSAIEAGWHEFIRTDVARR